MNDLNFSERIVKRLFDVVGAAFGLVVFSPVFLLLSALIKVRMPGPVFFRQKRVGQHSLLFTMVKFRTMIVNHGGSSVTVRGENRITPLGAMMRKYKLDELPELWNILKGDMSFVGPRPDVPGYMDQLKNEDRILLTIKPGLTGAASLRFSSEEELLALQNDPVNFNDKILFPEKVRININYMNHYSFWLDIKIIIFTIIGKPLSEPWAQSNL